jgi:hypothetical protein
LEVRVTHACSQEKIDEYKRQRLPVLEIDLSRFPPERFDPKAVEDVVLRESQRKEWLWPPRPPAATSRQLPPLHPVLAPAAQLPQEKPASEGPPQPATHRFSVGAWKAVVTVDVRPASEEGIVIRVSDMPTGALASTNAEFAAPRIADLIKGLVTSICPEAHAKGAGAWLVPAWHAPAVARAITIAALSYGARSEEQREALLQALNEHMGSGSRKTAPEPSQLPHDGPHTARDNPYVSRRG